MSLLNESYFPRLIEETSTDIGKRFEKRVRRYLIKIGCKNIRHGKKGQCDWIALDKKGDKIFVECKKSKTLKPSSWQQADFLGKHKDLGHKVYIAYGEGNKIILHPYRRKMKRSKPRRVNSLSVLNPRFQL